MSLPLACQSEADYGDGAYQGEAWADNWFSMWVDGSLVVEDSVSITTERSFNAEVFSFDATPPFLAAFKLMDFKETDSGLEYIGESNQQMGDGGFITQIRDASSATVLVSDDSWRCLVTHEAPLNKDCESSADPDADCEYRTADEPDGWMDLDFDDSGWATATEHSEASVSPKDGYDEFSWDSAAQLVWGADLESDNTILCRARVD